MKIASVALIALLLAGCAATGGIAPDAGQRGLYGVACGLKLAALGLDLSGDGMTSEERLVRLTEASRDPLIADACASVAAGLAQDVAAAKAQRAKAAK